MLAAVPFRGGSVRVIDVQTPLACAVGRAGTIVISRALADGIEPEALRAVLRTEGLRGLYKGYVATVGSFGPYSALYFAFYEQCKPVGS